MGAALRCVVRHGVALALSVLRAPVDGAHVKRTRMRRKSRLRLASKRRPTVKQLDALCRQVVMARDRNQCQLVRAGMGACGGHLQACHIYGKGAHPALRFDPENVIAGCWRHHAPQSPASWHSNPMVYVDWFRAEYPERAKRLLLLSQTRRRVDASATRLYLESLLKA